MRVSFTIDGPAHGKARPRTDFQTGRVHEDPKSAKIEVEVGKLARHAFGPGDPWTGPVRVTITAIAQIPKSWPKRYGLALAHGQMIYDDGKPDGDNIEKLIWDACSEIMWRDDAQVVDWHGRKRYGSPERVEVVVEQVVDAMGAPPMPTPAQINREKVSWSEVLAKRAALKAARRAAKLADKARGQHKDERTYGGFNGFRGKRGGQ